jgi:hypothetical protein
MTSNRRNSYNKDEYYDADEDTSSDEEDTDEEEEQNETDYFFSRGRSEKELNFILNHAIKHPPKISVDHFICALCYDRLSKRWTNTIEKKYQKILRNYEKDYFEEY